MDTYDVIVIGAGAVGENAAAIPAQRGLRVAIVESHLVGGECSYWACIPSKTLLNPGRILEFARSNPATRSAVTGSLEPGSVFRRRDEMVSEWDDSSQADWVADNGIELIRGHARLAGERSVAVTGDDGRTKPYRAERAVIVATGSEPVSPDIEGIEDITTWTSRDLTGATEVPARLAIVGGGAVGVEMAQAWAWLGSEVTLIHNSERLLAAEEPFVGEEIARALRESGVRVVTDADTKRVRPVEGGAALEVDVAGEIEEIVVDEVAVAAGRRPRTDDLGVESVGLSPGDPLEVDDHMLVTGVGGDWLYAVGDVNDRALLTHAGKYQARIAGAHASGVAGAAVDAIPATPRVIFTNPEVAAVGLTEQQAADAGISVDVVTHDIGAIAAAGTLGEGYSGTAELVIDRCGGVVVGATFVGPQVAELLHSATVAIVGRVPLRRLWHAVPAFPTFSEVWLRLLESYRDAGWDPYAP